MTFPKIIPQEITHLPWRHFQLQGSQSRMISYLSLVPRKASIPGHHLTPHTTLRWRIGLLRAEHHNRKLTNISTMDFLEEEKAPLHPPIPFGSYSLRWIQTWAWVLGRLLKLNSGLEQQHTGIGIL